MSSKDDVNDHVSAPPAKKLKQARLPFKILPTKPVSPVQHSQSGAVLNPLKKRKLSDGAPGPAKSTKAKCVEKEVPVIAVDRADNEVSSSSEAETSCRITVIPDENKRPAKQKGLLDKFVKTTPTQKAEISTSCDDVVDLTSDSTNDGEIVTSTDKTESQVSIKSAVPANCNVKVAEESTDETQRLPTNSTSGGNDVDDAEIEKELNNSVCSGSGSVLDDSTVSEADLNSSVASLDTSITTSSSKPKTPRSALKQEEKLMRQAERERLKAEKQKKVEEERAEKARLKQELKEKKEKERLELKQKKEKEKQEKLEKLQKEKDEKLRLKEEERKKKEEEKEEERRKKQEIIDAKNREKKRKEDEKLREEEEIRQKKEKEQQVFNKFFTKAEKQAPSDAPTEQKKGLFFPFEVKKDMKLAPCLRVEKQSLPTRAAVLDERIQTQESEELYIDLLRSGKTKPGKSGQTWPLVEDVELITSPRKLLTSGKVEKLRGKLLQFRENYRPAYYGTWRKTSTILSPKNPFKKDESLFDYEVDSDDEWEEEEPGESLSHSEGEDSDGEAGSDDGEDEDGFFVPHGYLSEGEGCESEDEDNSPEKLKARQLAKAKAFESDMKQTCQVLQPVCMGCCWWSPTAPPDPNLAALSAFSVVTFETTPITLKPQKPKESQAGTPAESKEGKQGFKLKPVPPEAFPDLLSLVHGNSAGIKKLMREFRQFWRKKTSGSEAISETPHTPVEEDAQADAPVTPSASDDCDDAPDLISKRQLGNTIRNIAVYERRDIYPAMKCWYVKDDILDKYELKSLPVPTKWTWLTRNSPRKRAGAPKVSTPKTPNTEVKISGDLGGPAPLTPSMKQFAVAQSSPMFVSPNTNKETPDTNKQSPAVTNSSSVKSFLIPRDSPNFAPPSSKKSTPNLPANSGTPVLSPKINSPSLVSAKGTTSGSLTPKRNVQKKIPGALFKSPPSLAPSKPHGVKAAGIILSVKNASKEVPINAPSQVHSSLPGESHENPMEID